MAIRNKILVSGRDHRSEVKRCRLQICTSRFDLWYRKSEVAWLLLSNPSFKSIEFDGFKTQPERLIRLNKIAIQQMQVLANVENRKMLK